MLHATGGPYSLLLPRSSDFSALFDILKVGRLSRSQRQPVQMFDRCLVVVASVGCSRQARYPNPEDRIFLFSAMQLLWDRV
jgi:hypothetical protein